MLLDDVSAIRTLNVDLIKKIAPSVHLTEKFIVAQPLRYVVFCNIWIIILFYSTTVVDDYPVIDGWFTLEPSVVSKEERDAVCIIYL